MAPEQLAPRPRQQLARALGAEVRPERLDQEVSGPGQQAAVDAAPLDRGARHRLGRDGASGGDGARRSWRAAELGSASRRGLGGPRSALGGSGRRRWRRFAGVEPPPQPRELHLGGRAHLDVLAARGEPLEVGHVLAPGQVADQDLPDVPVVLEVEQAVAVLRRAWRPPGG